MKDNQSTNGFEAMQQTFGVLAPLRSALGANWVNYWRSQDKILDIMQEFSREWFERRHEATKTALDAAQRSCEANSPAEVVREFQAWMMGSMQRVVADGLACQKHLIAMAELSAPPAASGDAREIKASAPANVRKGTADHAKAA
jgi:hypothetical protein